MKKGKRLVGMGHKIKKNKLENRRWGKKKKVILMIIFSPIGLGRMIIGFQSISSYQIYAWNIITHFQIKKHGKMSFWICIYVFFNIIFISIFSIHFPPICISFISNSILILINIFESNSISLKFNSRCMQCHSIFSFKWNLILTKSIHVFIN